ncbi:outer membrane beta-barrel protein [Vibrio tapetis]|uniref:Capsular polysaccharide synthesis enzyme CpsB n=1 Tax=Vibrio tapetis subsp. tapetis TaxID=1671868 RepID=A0A2N8ZLK0_9VIBR|nr:outer membrane beta-barrel protein [Vibrio tapetis]SON52791.1 Capsular polysaccharide synthesis enzyme CpsB [Vibrio tapetis subsp. tapetis]
MTALKKTQIAISVALLTTTTVHAEERGYITESGINILPLLEVAFSYDDNLGRYSNALDAESSSIITAAPGVEIKSDRGGNSYSATYIIENGYYTNSNDDNYLDHYFATNNFVRVNNRHGLGLNYTFSNQHESRGTGVSAGDDISSAIKEPVKYDRHDANTTYVYGSDNAKGRVELTLDFESLTYKNYRELTNIGGANVSARFKDYAQYGADLAFYYQYLPATQLLVQVDHNRRKYDWNNPNTLQSQDYIDSYYYLGATWDMTGKTTGKVRLGKQHKSYSDSNKDSFGGFSWDLELEWKPVKHSTVELSASQRTQDSDQSFVDIKTHLLNVAWKHYWQEQIYSYVRSEFIRDEYSGDSQTDRILDSRFSLGYELTDTVELAASWNLVDKNSTREANTYDQNVFSISANLLF